MNESCFLECFLWGTRAGRHLYKNHLLMLTATLWSWCCRWPQEKAGSHRVKQCAWGYPAYTWPNRLLLNLRLPARFEKSLILRAILTQRFASIEINISLKCSLWTQPSFLSLTGIPWLRATPVSLWTRMHNFRIFLWGPFLPPHGFPRYVTTCLSICHILDWEAERKQSEMRDNNGW